jgi:hypothetical protein
VQEYEGDDEEGCLNAVMGENDALGGEGWRTSNDSWLKMDKEDEGKVFHVNVAKGEEPNNRRTPSPPPCLTKEFADWKLRKKQERKEKMASGNYIPGCLTEEEEYVKR